MNEKIKQRFSRKFRILESECWEWLSTLHRDGYGKFWIDGKNIQAHRVSYRIFISEIPIDNMILHTCDNRKCVNPKHLYAGTAKQNYQDAVVRRRFIGRRKIPYEIVQKSISLYRTGQYTQEEIGKMLGISQLQVSRYASGKQRLNY